MSSCNGMDARAGLKDMEYLSFSALSVFQACPLRFYFRYVAHLQEETISSSLVFGSAIHASLAFHFDQLLAHDRPPSLDTLLDVFWEEWRSQTEKLVIFNRGEDLNSIGQLAARMLQAFQLSAMAQPKGTIIAVEEELHGTLVPGCPDLLGRLDLVVESDDALLITDWKTGRMPWSRDHVNQLADQLLIYHELARPLSNGMPIRLAFAVLTKTSNPQLTLHPVSVDPRRLQRTHRIIQQVWHSIEAGLFYPSPSHFNCRQCPYRHPCKQWPG